MNSKSPLNTPESVATPVLQPCSTRAEHFDSSACGKRGRVSSNDFANPILVPVAFRFTPRRLVRINLSGRR
jgi:hypothetical protein